MGIINYTNQLKYTGKGYLDAKMMPVETVDDLKKISLTQRFEGLTITVLNNGNPQDYWLVGGTTNKYWVPKTDNTNLRLILEDGFLKLFDGDKQLDEPVDLNDFFPENSGGTKDLYIESVDYTTTDDNGNEGVFLQFTYSNDTVKYLDMGVFLSNVYEAGSGIVINGNVISLDSAISGRIELLENNLLELSKNLDTEISDRKKSINDLIERISALQVISNGNTVEIGNIKAEISTINEKIEDLSNANVFTPDKETIDVKDNEPNTLYVKILEKNGNILKSETNEKGESGLFASIPVFFEDEELYNK